jgi:heat shock protein HslJ
MTIRRGAAAALAILALAGCGQGAGGAGEWPADRTFYSTSVTEAGRPKEFLGPLQLRFFADGRLDAMAGCNHIGGRGKIENGKLVVDDLGTTEMGCERPYMEQDAWLATFLGGRPAWKLTGNVLRLRADDVEIDMTDRRVLTPDLSLVGTYWRIDTLFQGDVASSTPDVGFLMINADGTFRAGTDCGEIRGRAAVGATTVEFSGVTASPSVVPCPSGAASLHQVITDILKAPVTYHIEGSQLTLTAADGGGGLGLRFPGAG